MFWPNIKEFTVFVFQKCFFFSKQEQNTTKWRFDLLFKLFIGFLGKHQPKFHSYSFRTGWWVYILCHKFSFRSVCLFWYWYVFLPRIFLRWWRKNILSQGVFFFNLNSLLCNYPSYQDFLLPGIKWLGATKQKSKYVVRHR